VRLRISRRHVLRGRQQGPDRPFAARCDVFVEPTARRRQISSDDTNRSGFSWAAGGQPLIGQRERVGWQNAKGGPRPGPRAPRAKPPALAHAREAATGPVRSWGWDRVRRAGGARDLRGRARSRRAGRKRDRPAVVPSKTPGRDFPAQGLGGAAGAEQGLGFPHRGGTSRNEAFTFDSKRVAASVLSWLWTNGARIFLGGCGTFPVVGRLSRGRAASRLRRSTAVAALGVRALTRARRAACPCHGASGAAPLRFGVEFLAEELAVAGGAGVFGRSRYPRSARGICPRRDSPARRAGARYR